MWLCFCINSGKLHNFDLQFTAATQVADPQGYYKTIKSVPFDCTFAQAIETTPTGGTILVAPGVYTPESPIVIRDKSLSIHSVVPESFNGGFKKALPFLTSRDNASPLLCLEGNSVVEVKGLIFQGPINKSLIKVTGNAKLTLESCKIENRAGVGIHIGNESQVRILGCIIWYCASHGILMSHRECGVLVKDSYIEHNKTGIAVYGGCGFVRRTQIESSSTHAIVIRNGGCALMANDCFTWNNKRGLVDYDNSQYINDDYNSGFFPCDLIDFSNNGS